MVLIVTMLMRDDWETKNTGIVVDRLGMVTSTSMAVYSTMCAVLICFLPGIDAQKDDGLFQALG